MTLEELVDISAQQWPAGFCGDVNLVDVNHIARAITHKAGLSLPMALPPKEVGLRLVELVEGEFIKGVLIRSIEPGVLATRAARVSDFVHTNEQLGYDRTTSFVISLFTWHGCIFMAKLLRPAYVTAQGEQPYTEALRLDGYRTLQSDWEQGEAERNLWIRYGVSLARNLATARGNGVVEGWVPAGSPYWI